MIFFPVVWLKTFVDRVMIFVEEPLVTIGMVLRMGDDVELPSNWVVITEEPAETSLTTEPPPCYTKHMLEGNW